MSFYEITRILLSTSFMKLISIYKPNIPCFLEKKDFQNAFIKNLSKNIKDKELISKIFFEARKSIENFMLDEQKISKKSAKKIDQHHDM